MVNPPIIDKLPEFRFPAIETGRLSDNSSVYFVEDSSQPVVSVKLMIRLGAYFEHIPGLCSITSQLLTKGTQKRSAIQIADEVEFLGASLSCNGSWDETSFMTYCLTDHLGTMLEIMADCFFNSEMSADELERSRKKNISSILQDQSDPGYLSAIVFLTTWFRKHPYGHPLSGTAESLAAISREDCLNWYKALCSSPLVFFVAGNFDKEAVTETLENLFIRPKAGNAPIDRLKGIPMNTPSGSHLNLVALNKPDSQQASLKIGMPSIGREHTDYPLLQVVNTVYGGYFLSRLNALLREELGYTYGVGSSVNSRLLGSYLSVTTKVNDSATRDSIDKSIEEMRKISLYPITAEEHSRALQYILGSFIRNIETPQQIMTFLYTIDLFSLPPTYYDDFYNRIAASQLDEIYEIQKKYFVPDKLTVALTGNFDTILKEIGGLGTIETYSTIEEFFGKNINL